jgi:hypothetical protein
MAKIASVMSSYPPQIQAAAAQHAASLPTGRDLARSSCKGNKKALLIGCNYYKSANELRGCINDVKNVKGQLNVSLLEYDVFHFSLFSILREWCRFFLTGIKGFY